MEGNMPQGEMGGASNQGQPNNQGQENNQGQSQSQSGASSTASSTADAKADIKGIVGQLEAVLNKYMVEKAPFALPMGLKEFVVKVSPYLVIIFAAMSAIAVLAVFGFSSAFVPYAMMGGYGFGTGVMTSLVTTIIVLVLEVIAIPGLFKRTQGAWRLMFYASIVNVIGSLLILNIIGAVLSALIGWYIIFQLKDMYKN